MIITNIILLSVLVAIFARGIRIAIQNIFGKNNTKA
mgnify:CR=1 FL=1|jgi:hypothetical protein